MTGIYADIEIVDVMKTYDNRYKMQKDENGNYVLPSGLS